MSSLSSEALDALLLSEDQALRQQAVELLISLADPALWQHALAQVEDASTHTGRQLRLALYRNAPPDLCRFRMAWARINADSTSNLWFLHGSRPLYRLHLRHARLETIAALPHLPGLTHLTLANLKDLPDLDGLAVRCPDLEVLRLEVCPQLRSLRGLADCTHAGMWPVRRSH